MQGVIFDIKHFAVHDGPGIRTTVFLKGCPLRCFWCHNPESMDMNPTVSVKTIKMDGREFGHCEEVGIVTSVDDVMAIVLKDQIFMEESGGGVTFSGGEPTMQPAFLLALLQACKKENINTAVDTCGFVSQKTLEAILSSTDLFLFDFKHLDPNKHMNATGKSNEIILGNLEFLLNNKKKIRIRIPIIPGFNYTEKDLATMAAFLSTKPGNIEQIDLLPYHNIAKNKYKRFGYSNPMEEINSLKKDDVLFAKETFEAQGFKVKIGG